MNNLNININPYDGFLIYNILHNYIQNLPDIDINSNEREAIYKFTFEFVNNISKEQIEELKENISINVLTGKIHDKFFL